MKKITNPKSKGIKKGITTVTLITVLAANTAFANDIIVNGEKQEMNSPVIFTGGYNYAPIGEIFSIFDANVKWVQETKTAVITKDGTKIEVIIGSNVAYINDKAVNMPAPALINEDRTYAPIAFIAEALGYKVEWNGDAKAVYITALQGKVPVSVDTSYKTDYEDNLTYDEAYEKAIAQSSDLRIFMRSMEDLADARNRYATNYASMVRTPADAYTGFIWDEGIKAALSGLEAMDTTIGNKEYTKQIYEGAIALSVRSSFVNISLAIDKIGMTKAQIELSADALKHSKLLLDMGMLSKTEYDRALLTHKQLEDSLVLSERALETEYTALNKILGYNTDYRYNIINDFKYSPLPDNFSIDDYVTKVENANPNLKIAANDLKKAEMDLKLYQANSAMTYAQTETAAAQSSFKYDDAKQTFRKNVRDAYSKIRDIEIQIKSAELDIDKAKTAEQTVRIQLEAGTVTELSLKQAILSVESANTALKSLKAQHTMQVFLFENAFLL